MNICIFGGNGTIGLPLSKFLTTLGYEVDSCDPSYQIKSNPYITYGFHNVPRDVPKRYDMFVSCAPTYLNEEIRAEADRRKIKYVDFGGDYNHQKLVYKDRKNCRYGVLTGIGLAPGYVNIMASSYVKELISYGIKPRSVSMCVGGISKNPKENELGWLPTWSIKGLIQSYTGECKRVRDGKIELINNLKEFYFPYESDGKMFEFEMFNNSGGMSHTAEEMINYGVENCDYYTIRWAGHVKKVKKILEHNTPEESEKVIYNMCNTGGKDCVYSIIFIDQHHVNFMQEPSKEFTGMQIATAGPAAVVIKQILEKNLKGYLTYNDIDGILVTKDFQNLKDNLGIK